MKRRSVLLSLVASAGVLTAGKSQPESKTKRGVNFSLDGNVVQFYHPSVKETFSVIMLSDTHLHRDDERGVPFQQYSGRMAKAYNVTKHVETLEPTNPEICFEKTLEIAKKDNVNLLALVGDIFSFPSEAAIEWLSVKLKNADLPYVYVAGNHDWHYEGMAGSISDLRKIWVQNRLLPLYQNQDPLMTIREIKGVNIIFLDNSDYQITSEQLEFFRSYTAKSNPLLLMMHIPVYAHGRGLGFGCVHPDWGAHTDKSFELEKRERWPEKGHSATTMSFYNEVLNAPNLLGILAGHTHKQSLDLINGIPQIVANDNARGGYLKVVFNPLING